MKRLFYTQEKKAIFLTKKKNRQKKNQKKTTKAKTKTNKR